MGQRQAWLTRAGHGCPLALGLACLGLDSGPPPEVPRRRVVTEIDQAEVVNRPPRFLSIAPRMAREGRPYNYGIAAYDPDGDEVRYRLVQAPEGAKLVGKALKWVPKPNQVGHPQQFTLRATDEHGAVRDQVWRVTPRSSGAPEFRSHPPLRWSGAGAYSYPIRLALPAGDPQQVTVTLAQGPEGTRLTGSGLHWTLTWQPLPTHGKTFELRFSLNAAHAAHAAGAATTQTWRVKVREEPGVRVR